MDSFLSREEIKQLGLATCGEDVFISRYARIYSPEMISIGNHVRIDDFTVISGKVTLGNYIHIATFCGMYGGNSGIWMEDFTTLSSKCSVYALSDDYTGESMTNPMIPLKYKPKFINAPVVIKRHAIIGCNSVLLPGVTIEEGTAVGSMTLCNRSTMPWTIYVGSPARYKGARSKKILELEQEFWKDHAERREENAERG